MKGRSVRYLVFTCAFLCAGPLLYGWGFWAHVRINRASVFALPEEMRKFYYNHIDYLTEEAPIPDVRIYAISDRAEANRHFLDMEYLQRKPGEVIPQVWKEARAKYKDSLLQESGILPWYIDSLMTKLTTAFKDRNKPYILFLSADLAHYLGDANVPLHTTENYNGQLTNQRGIHSLWESFLTERFGSAYDFYTGDAQYVSDVRKEIWATIDNSHRLVDSVLSLHKTVSAMFPGDKAFIKDSAGNVAKNRYNQTTYTMEYGKKYHELLNGMVERQLRRSIRTTSNFWYTAWVNAGKPSLDDMDSESLTKRNKKNYKSELRLWKKGHLFGLKQANEY